MGFYALLGFWSAKAVLCVEVVRHEEELSKDEVEVYEQILHAHLVRRLAVLGMLSGRSVQLLRHCELAL